MTSKPGSNSLSKPKHDNFFSYSIHIPKVAKGFLQKHLPKELLSKINLESIAFEKTDFISKALKKNISDCLIKVEVQQEAAYIYTLVEHQSTIDSFMPLRIMEYMLLIWKNFRKQNPKEKRLPLIYPIILSNAEDAHLMPTSPFQLFENQELAEKFLFGPYRLVDLLQMSEDSAEKGSWVDFMELALKYRKTYEFLDSVKKLEYFIKNFAENEQGYDYIEAFFWYNASNISEEYADKVNNLLHEILNERGDYMGRSLAQKWYDDAEARGIAEGEYRKAVMTAKNLLAEGIAIPIISRCTSLSIAEINKIKSGQ